MTNIIGIDRITFVSSILTVLMNATREADTRFIFGPTPPELTTTEPGPAYGRRGETGGRA